MSEFAEGYAIGQGTNTHGNGFGGWGGDGWWILLLLLCGWGNGNWNNGGNNMTKTMKIEGMMCGHCSGRVKKVLEEHPDVLEAVVSHEEGTAVVTLNDDVENDVLKGIVEEEGYTVVGIE